MHPAGRVGLGVLVISCDLLLYPKPSWQSPCARMRRARVSEGVCGMRRSP